VLFWSDYSKSWEAPRSQSGKEKNTSSENPKTHPTTVTKFTCPVCKKPLEEYYYTKDGQDKKLLRCSDPKSRTDVKHKDVAFFHTAKGWWSPKFGELEVISEKGLKKKSGKN
jgi:DNA topoisomerase I